MAWRDQNISPVWRAALEAQGLGMVSTPFHLAELVDDKAGQCKEPYIVENVFDGGVRDSVRCVYDKGHMGPHGILDQCAPGGKFEWVNSTDACADELAVAKGVVELCRALAQPTKQERFEEFKWECDLALSGYDAVTVRYDWGKYGPTVWLSAPGMYETPLTPCSEVTEAVSRHIDDMALLIGRRILRGGK